MAFSKFRVRKGIRVSTATTPAGLELIPVGTIVMWSSNTTIPTGFLECVGGTQLRASYPDLNSFLAGLSTPYPYGAGNGSTTFGIPDFRGRIPVGVITAAAVGGTSGTEAHSITSANIPDHSHAITAHSHSVTASPVVGSMNNNSVNHTHNFSTSSFGNETGDHTHSGGDHGHSWLSATDVSTGTTRTAVENTTEVWVAISVTSAPTATESANHTHGFSATSGGISANHTHGFNTSASASDTDNGNTASNTAFQGTTLNHMNPFTVVRFLIKH